MNCVFKSLTKGSACVACGRKLAMTFRSHPIATCRTVCRHLGPAIGANVTIVCVCKNGTSKVKLPIHVCALSSHPECLPTFSCSPVSKQALSEEWSRSDGDDPNALMPCVDCRYGGLGFQAVDAGVE